MSINTIELRQADAYNVNANGDYECNLSKDVTISEGDTVLITHAFVDSVKESNINITDNLTLTIQSGVYFTDWLQLTGNFINNQGIEIPCGGATANSPSFRRFIPYLGIDAGALTGYSNYTGYEYKIDYTGNNEPAFPITYSYLDYMNRPQSFHTQFPALTRKVNTTYTDTFNIVAKTGSLKVVSPSSTVFAEIGTTLLGPVGNAITNKLYQPFVFTTEISLPKGVYSPQQITTYISEQLSSANLGPNVSSQTMSQSKFLFAATDFDNGKDNPDGAKNPTTNLPIPLTEQTTFISDDGLLSYQFPIGAGRFIGTSQIALEYDSTADKFNFTYCHSPMLDATTGANQCVRFLHRGLLANGDVNGITDNGGIYFNSLTAKNSRGVNVDFWAGLLGFDLNSICVGTQPSISNNYGLEGLISLSDPLVEGVNITSGYYGLDAGIVRGAGTWYNRQTVPSSPTEGANNGICSTINTTNAIYSSKTLDELLNKFSHYILQTDLGFYNNAFIGSQWYRNINGIISKYYVYGSYAMAESDAAIQYVHSGSPIQLKSVHVRLLKSDKKLDINLGEDNTIIISIIKAGSSLVPINTPKKA